MTTQVTFNSTSNPAGVSNWILSPDGGAVIWKEGTTFYSAPITGGSPTTISNFSAAGDPGSNFEVALDGRTLFGLVPGNIGGQYSLWAAPTAGGNPIQLASLTGFNSAGGQWITFGQNSAFFFTDTKQLRGVAFPVTSTSSSYLVATASTHVFTFGSQYVYTSAVNAASRGTITRVNGGSSVIATNAIPAGAGPDSLAYFNSVTTNADGGIGSGAFTHLAMSGNTPVVLGPAVPTFRTRAADSSAFIVTPDSTSFAWYPLSGSPITLGPITTTLATNRAWSWGAVANLPSGLVWTRLGVTTGVQTIGPSSALSFSASNTWFTARASGAVSSFNLETGESTSLAAGGVTDSLAGASVAMLRSGSVLEVLSNTGGARTVLTNYANGNQGFLRDTDLPWFFAYSTSSTNIPRLYIQRADGAVVSLILNPLTTPNISPTGEFLTSSSSTAGITPVLVRSYDAAVLTLPTGSVRWIGPRRFGYVSAGVLTIVTIQ